jgi:hypothetical protein
MRICILGLSAVLCLPASLMADTIFFNFGPGDTFSNAPSAYQGSYSRTYEEASGAIFRSAQRMYGPPQDCKRKVWARRQVGANA